MNLDTFSMADVADMIETVYNLVSTVMLLFSFIFLYVLLYEIHIK